MTPERQKLILDNCPSDADFTRKGMIVHVRVGEPLYLSPGGRTVVATLRYEKVMYLGPPRHFNIECEGIVVRSATY